MAVAIDWSTGIISVAKVDMVALGGNVWQLDMNVFRLDLKAQEAGTDGIPWLKTHTHNPPVSVSGANLARVVEIIPPYTVTFEDGQYAVNVVGANTNIGDVTNVNQVSIRTSNSAGLQDLNSLQAASYGGRVAVKASSSYSGTTFPVGTRQFPVNNLDDAHAIAEARGLVTFSIMESMTMNTTILTDGYIFEGDNPVTVLLTLDPSVDVRNAEFRTAQINGTLDGNNIFRECVIGNISYVNGFIFQCALTGTITLGGSEQLALLDCYSGVAGGGPGLYPKIAYNGGSNPLAVRNYSGGLAIQNSTLPNTSASIDMLSGRVVIDASVTEGNFVIRGIADVTDNSTGNAVVTDATISKSVLDTRKLIDADEVLDESASGNWVLVDSDDGTTVLRTRTVTDKNGDPITIPVGSPARRTRL